ncbi:MAG: FtsX-like permease family protein [Cyclobacteriaceae bacterium]|nr:FtsX-like permease family protein [Cyclobacteriaceae bacterium]
MKANRNDPPAFGTWLMELFGNSKEASNLLGDLHELYSRRLQENGFAKARLYYWVDFISILIHQPLRKKKTFHTSSNNMGLLFNYFKVASRNLMRQKLHTGINIVGLSIGFTFSLLIFLYVAHELSYDSFHKNGKNIYLLPMTWHFNETVMPTGANCSVGGPFMEDAFPEVVKSVRISMSALSFSKNGEGINEKDVFFADSTFFSIFTFPFLQGDSSSALTKPNSIVITRKSAEKYFGADWANQNTLGKQIVGTNGKAYAITGIIENVPSNSELQFNFVVSFSSLKISRATPTWDNSEFYTYVLLSDHADVDDIKSKIPVRMEEKFGKDGRSTIDLDLIPLREVYLQSSGYNVPNTSNIIYIRIFSFVATLIILIATINYINMATARSMERALEVGVRKVMGAERSQLFNQFLSESLIVTIFSLLMAIMLASLLLPAFNILTGKSLSLEPLGTPLNILLFIGGGLLISLLSGIYPAVFVSGYSPSKVLKGKLKDSSQGIRLRESLVLGQFFISILLIISTLMVSDQIRFIQNKSLGFERKKLVGLSLDSLSRTRINVLKNSLAEESIITHTTATYQFPTRISHQTAMSLKNETENDRKLLTAVCVDSDFVKTVGLEVAAGRDLTHNVDETSPTWEILINQSAADFFGWSEEEAIGKELKVWQTDGVIKGVLKDFHFSSLHDPISPLVVFSGNQAQRYSYLIVNISGSPTEIKNILETHWKKVNSESPFELRFLDEQYESMYKKETQLRNIINAFSVLAILISILGLFGLASYSILQRTKELGIRKVLGASITGLIGLVSKRFIRLVVIAFILAIPFNWYLMNQWLSTFAYHTTFNWWIVLGAGLTTILLAMGTVIYHAFEAARVNPSKTLRSQ